MPTPLPEFHLADALFALAAFPNEHFTSVITDPPYSIRHTSGEGDRPNWDTGDNPAFDSVFWADARRVTRDGGTLASFGHPKTYHRMASAIEDAGWQIFDILTWINGEGFPLSNQSLDVELQNLDADPALVEKYQGWGTRLRGSTELICLGRNPRPRQSQAKTIAAGGAGGVHLDIARTPTDDDRSRQHGVYNETTTWRLNSREWNSHQSTSPRRTAPFKCTNSAQR